MKIFLFAFSAFLVALPTFAFPTPRKDVPEQCADPTFACQDLQSARLCGVVKTCIHDIWATMSVPDDNVKDEICDICKEMVKEARDQLLSNMTQEEIKEVFEGSCKLLPVKIIADGCIKIVDEIIPELVEMLASRMDPNMVCTVSGMCFPSKSDNVIENHILSLLKVFLIKQKGAQCDACTTMIVDVQKFLKSASESDVKTYLEKACHEKMPSYLCNIIANTYFSDIYNYIVNTEASTLCNSAGICPQKCDLRTQAPEVKDELTCEFCEHILEHIKDLITTNTTMDEFKNALLNFCKSTGKFSEKCTSLVNDYYDMLFSYIKNLDSKGMCTLMGLCNNEKCSKMPLVKLVPSSEVHRKIPLIRLQPAEPFDSNDIDSFPLVRLIPAKVLSKKQLKETNDIFQPQLPIERLIHPFPAFEQDTECALCKAFSFYLETDLAGDRSKVGVRKTIDSICDKWMKDYPDHCSHIVSKYSQKIQVALAKGAAFEDLCPLMKVCPLEVDKSGELNVRVLNKVDGSPFCDLCKDAMQEVETQLSDPATKTKLENLFGQVCNVLPKSLRDDCVSFINQNIDAVIDILEAELKPDNICPALGLCSTASRLGVSQRVKDLECDVCKDVVTSFRQKLQDPASKEIVETFLEEGCARLPESVAAECKKFVDENIDTLMKIIIEEMDPEKVCKILSICPASVQKTVLLEAPKSNDVECELCKEVVSKVEDMIKDQKTEDEIKQALDKVCSYLPKSMAAKCESFVNQYTDLLITLLAQELDPGMVCAQLNLCPASVQKTVLLEAPKSNDVECELCKEVVSKVEDMIKDQKTEDEIKQALDKVCSYLPKSMETKCESFVNQYTDLLITLLTQELDPGMVCAELNLCPASEQKTVLLEAPKSNNVECELCKEVVSKVEDMIKDQKTEDEIKQALDKVCSYLPKSMAAKCESFVNQYTDLLITLLAQELDPGMVCAELNLCPEVVKKVEVAPLETSKLKDVECDLCKEVVGKLEEMVKDKKTEDEIKEALDKVCSYLPSSFATKCENFINQYSDLLITLLTQELDPDMICAALNLCPAKDIECQGCQYALHFLQEQLMNAQTQDKVKDVLKKMCSVLPGTYLQNCEAFIEEYGSSLLVLVAQEIDPSQLCFQIKMCNNKTSIFKNSQQEIKLSHFQLDECSVCTTVVDYMDKLIEEDDVDKEITHLVEKVCNVLPTSFRQQCGSILETYGPYILQMIGQMADSKQLCQEIEMCPRSPEQVHLIGGSKCTFGPSYWCKSQAHAASCKAESFCNEKVWKN